MLLLLLALAVPGHPRTPNGVAKTQPVRLIQQAQSATGPDLSGLALVSDDYTHYQTTADLLANISRNSTGGTGDPSVAIYSYATNANLLELDRSVLFNGHPTVKYNMPPSSAATPQLMVYFPGGRVLTDMWLHVALRFSPAWNTTGTLVNSGDGYKLLGWAWDNDNGRASIEFGIELNFILDAQDCQG